MEVPRSPESPVVSVEHLKKQFVRRDGSVVRAIDDVSFDVEAGDFIVLLGPSGCGKTTLLRSIAGLEQPDEGLISLGGRTQFSSADGVDVAPERRRISMVFQSYALWPHMTAFKNVAYPLESRRGHKNRTEIGARVREVLRLVGVPDLEDSFAAQMSGGQQQRVALARALACGDDLVLFDEPLSNVDAKVREQLRVELVSMQRELGFASIFVTHDQNEAMELGSRIAVLNAGRIAQLDTPQRVYHEPASRYVAKFIGSINESLGTIVSIKGDTAVVDTEGAQLSGRLGQPGAAVGDRVAAMWRPERGRLTLEEPVLANRWSGRLVASMFAGAHSEHLVQVGDEQVMLWTTDSTVLDSGTEVWVEVPDQDLLILPAGEDA